MSAAALDEWTRYEVTYDLDPVVEIQISPAALPAIKEMVEFWTNAEWRLKQLGGDYVKVWLTNLAEFIVTNDRLPKGFDEENGDEGWVSLDLKHGFSGVVNRYHNAGPDFDNFEVRRLGKEAA